MHLNKNPQAEKKRVLLVEDVDELLFIYEEMLSPDYEIMTAKTGHQALALASKVKPDLVVLDLHLQGLGGREVYEHFRASPLLSNVPIIFVTGWSEAPEFAQGDARAKTLLKPFRTAALRSEIEESIL